MSEPTRWSDAELQILYDHFTRADILDLLGILLPHRSIEEIIAKMQTLRAECGSGVPERFARGLTDEQRLANKIERELHQRPPRILAAQAEAEMGGNALDEARKLDD